MNGWMNEHLAILPQPNFQMLSQSSKGQGTMLRWALFALFVGICASARDDKKKKVEPKPFSRGEYCCLAVVWGVHSKINS